MADVYDALISRRVYKPPFSHERAIEMIVDERGSHFDPDIVASFLEGFDAMTAIADQYLDTGNPETP